MALPCAEILLRHLGSTFEVHYRDLEALYGDELDDGLVLEELADLLANLLLDPSRDEPAIELCCAALEELCTTPGIDPLATVHDRVLCALPPTALRRVRSYLGSAVEHLLAEEEERGDAEGVVVPPTES
jgi:hypothetical protein